MNIHLVLAVLRARAKIVFITLALTVTASVIVSLLLPKSYEASTSLVVNSKGTDALTGTTVPLQLVPGYISTYMNTQADIIRSINVAMRVVDEQKMAADPKLIKEFQFSGERKDNIREWIALKLLKQLTVTPSRESNVLVIGYKDRSPSDAARVLNSFVSVYQSVSIDMAVDPSRKAWRYINEQIKVIRENFEEAQRKVSAYQQENDIVQADGRIDVEMARLSELASKVIRADDELSEAQSRSRLASGAQAAGSPDVSNNPVVQTLKTELARAQSRLASSSEKLTPSHPQYIQIKAEVVQLQAELAGQLRAGSKTVDTSSKIYEQRALQTRTALENQRLKVMQLSQKRDQLALLINEMENAKRSYETVSQRLLHTNLQGHSNQSDMSVVSEALPPSKPSSPNIPLNLILSVLMGSILGLSVAGAMELRDPRVRSSQSLSQLLSLPILGEVRRNSTSKPKLLSRPEMSRLASA